MRDETTLQKNVGARFLRFWNSPPPRAEIVAWLFVIAAIAGIRVYVWHLAPVYLWSRDSPSYAQSAFQWIHAGAWESNPRRGPVYSLVIAACLKLWGSLDSLVVLQHVLGGASVLAAVLVLRLLHGPRAMLAVLLCGYAYAVYALPVSLEHLVRNETLLFVFATLAFVSWFLAIKHDTPHWLWLCGISTALLMLTKNVFGPFPLVVLGAQIFLHKSKPLLAAKHAAIFAVALVLPFSSAAIFKRLTVHTRSPEPQAGILFYGRTAQFTVLDDGIETEVKKIIRKDIEDYRKLPRLDNNIILKHTAVPHMQAWLVSLGKTPSDLNKLCWSLSLEAIHANKLRYLRQVLHDCSMLLFKSGSRVWSPNAGDLLSSKAAMSEDADPDPLLHVEQTFQKIDAAAQPEHFKIYSALAHTAWLFLLAPMFFTSALLPLCIWRERSALRWWWLGAAAIWYFTIAMLCTVGRPLDRYLLPVAPIMFWTLGSAFVWMQEWLTKRLEAS